MSRLFCTRYCSHMSCPPIICGDNSEIYSMADL
uniref:Uncharacterized protein n=1 Tax=Anguilla anguilla TaxID=7936 RepID=A0A0E9VJS5_ANGAN